MALVFVYGTLLRGEANHGLLRTARTVDDRASVRGVLYDTGDGYPALALDEASDRPVAGEVYEVDAPTLAALDELEDYFGPGDSRNLYERLEVETSGERGTYRALVYAFPRARAAACRPIPQADWRAYRRSASERGNAASES